MVMCSKCHKRVAVVFVNKVENGNKLSEGLCIKCARELGIPVDNMLGNMMNQMGITPEQLESMENEMNDYISENLPTSNDDLEEGGAPAIDIPQLFGDSGMPVPQNERKSNGRDGKKSDTQGANFLNEVRNYKPKRNITAYTKTNKYSALHKFIGNRIQYFT